MLTLAVRARKMHDLFGEGFPSGQRDQTVNLTRKLRWFESTPLHHIMQVAGRNWRVIGESG